jgi:hypothetical protein
MSDYTATIGCLNLKVDWSETQDRNVIVRYDEGGLTEAKIFMNASKATYHDSLELLGNWMESHKFLNTDALVNELFQQGSEENFAIVDITRPQKSGDSGFVDLEIGFDVIDSWCVLTDKGTLPTKCIQLIMRVSILPTN